jgi:hypothetical protein
MVRGRLTVQEGRNVQYNGIIHATRCIFREVCGWAGGRLQTGEQLVCMPRPSPLLQERTGQWILTLSGPVSARSSNCSAAGGHVQT